MRVAILANVPVWILPGLENLKHDRHFATWLEALIPEFADQTEVEIHWITMCKESKQDLIHHAHGQVFHILSRRSLGTQMVTLYTSEIFRIKKKLKAISPDLVHAWGTEDVYGIAGSLCGTHRRLFTLQGCLSEYCRRLGGSWLFRLQAFYEKPTIRRYHRATAESPAAAELLRDINPKLEINLVDYGVNPEFFRSKWEPERNPNVLFLGSITKRKGIADLVDVAARPEMKDVTFYVAGEGDLRSELELKSPENVHWLGGCSRKKVIGLLEGAWALYIPTYSDTGPTVVKEARVIGLPVVTTTGAGASSYINDAGCGFISEPGDVEFQVQALAELTSSVERAVQLGKKGHKEHREILHPKTTAKNLVKIYQSL